MTLHRSRDVTQDDDRARALEATPPDPVDEVPAGTEVASVHGPRRKPRSVRVELVTPRQPGFEVGPKQVDEPLGIAELRVRHPVEVAVMERLARAEGARRDHPASIRLLLIVARSGLALSLGVGAAGVLFAPVLFKRRGFL